MKPFIENSTPLLVGMLLVMKPTGLPAEETLSKRPRDNWDFKFKDFVIGAWWGPGPTEPEVKLYREAGFNVVMSGRYMQLDHYGDADQGLQELDLAHRYGLGVMFDTYTQNDRPWGGRAGPYEPHPIHHPASLIELQWLHGKVGYHPALIGYMIGDDQGAVGERSDACTQFLFALPKPHLMPWLCGWISPQDLAAHNNPIVNPQIYPTLYQWGLPSQELARQYAAAYAGFSRQCRDLGLLFWPMFNVSPPNEKEHISDSLLRFPAYAAVAYGAEGLWYFCYNGGSLQKPGNYRTEEEVRAALTPLYPVAKEINHRLLAWGRRVLGRTSPGLFGTAFGAKESGWPFPADLVANRSPEALASPAPGKLIEAMSDDLLVGLLVKPGEPLLAMVVDCRTSKEWEGIPPREVMVRLAPAVTGVNVLEGAQKQPAAGSEVTLTLQAGGGQLLELEGTHLEALSTEEAIYAAPPPEPTAVPRPLTDQDLANLRAAKLRLDVFGSNGEEQFRRKFIEVNGHRLGEVPANYSDSWSLKVVDFSPDQLSWLQSNNEVVMRTECGDAWKFRNVTLAVQLADGAWVKTASDPTVHSVPDWAHSEGQTWGPDGVAGPIRLRF